MVTEVSYLLSHHFLDSLFQKLDKSGYQEQQVIEENILRQTCLFIHKCWLAIRKITQTMNLPNRSCARVKADGTFMQIPLDVRIPSHRIDNTIQCLKHDSAHKAHSHQVQED